LHFLRRNRVLLTSALCLGLAAVLVVQTGRTPARSDRLGRFFLEVMAPLQRSTAAVGRTVSGAWHGIGDVLRARSENVALRARARLLEQELDRLSEVALENGRLRALLEFRETLQGELQTARVIGRDASGVARTLTIDRGESDGVVRSAAALCARRRRRPGLSREPARRASALVSDHNSGVDALVQRTRAPASCRAPSTPDARSST
jgi:rod shape-determining protein MreC